MRNSRGGAPRTAGKTVVRPVGRRVPCRIYGGARAAAPVWGPLNRSAGRSWERSSGRGGPSGTAGWRRKCNRRGAVARADRRGYGGVVLPGFPGRTTAGLVEAVPAADSRAVAASPGNADRANGKASGGAPGVADRDRLGVAPADCPGRAGHPRTAAPPEFGAGGSRRRRGPARPRGRARTAAAAPLCARKRQVRRTDRPRSGSPSLGRGTAEPKGCDPLRAITFR